MPEINKNFEYRKVLVIDDNPIDLYLAKKHIEMSSFAEEVVLKESASAGLDYLRSISDQSDQLPELIFLDIRMPEMDGFDFLEEYLKLPKTVIDKCNIAMLTSSSDEIDIKRAGDNKLVSKFLNKPLDKAKLAHFNSIEFI